MVSKDEGIVSVYIKQHISLCLGKRKLKVSRKEKKKNNNQKGKQQGREEFGYLWCHLFFLNSASKINKSLPQYRFEGLIGFLCPRFPQNYLQALAFF